MRIKAVMTITREYDVELDCYHGETDPEKIMDIDRAGFQDDPYLFVDGADSIETVLTITKHDL